MHAYATSLGNTLCDVGDVCPKEQPSGRNRPWDSMELQTLRSQRRSATISMERKIISKKIWRLTRDQLRRYRTQEAEKKLTEFSDL